MAGAYNALQAFVVGRNCQHRTIVDWPTACLEVALYLHPVRPPDEFITSVRAIVLRDDHVLVVQDPTGYHIVPGGRREKDEGYTATAVREVAEETGWHVRIEKLLGFLHFRRLTPKPPDIAYPHADFAQLIYLATALAFRPEAREQNGYELGAEFVPVTQLSPFKIDESQLRCLQAAGAI